MALILQPAPGRVLVELGTNYKHIDAPARAYEGKSNGIAREVELRLKPTVTEDEYLQQFPYASLVGKRVFWQDGRERGKINQGNKQYTFVALDDIDGFEVEDGE